MIRLMTLIIIISSTAWAEEVERFEGLQSTKKDGVIVIEINPTADREKLRKKAEQEAKRGQIMERQRLKKEAAERERDRIMIEQERERASYRTHQPYRSHSPEREETGTEREAKYYRKEKRELEQQERNEVGGVSKWTRDYYDRRGEYIDQKLRDIEKHPEDY